MPTSGQMVPEQVWDEPSRPGQGLRLGAPGGSAVPLVWAHGAAQISRRDIGTSVFAGMLIASTIGIFLIPMLYVVFQRLREWKPGARRRQRVEARQRVAE